MRTAEPMADLVAHDHVPIVVKRHIERWRTLGPAIVVDDHVGPDAAAVRRIALAGERCNRARCCEPQREVAASLKLREANAAAERPTALVGERRRGVRREFTDV